MKSDEEIKNQILGILDLFIGTGSAEDLCKKIVHNNPFGQLQADGCFLYMLDSKSEVLKVGGYGRERFSEGEAISVWDPHPISVAIRTRTTLKHEPDAVANAHLIVFPLTINDMPIGAMVISLLEAASASILSSPIAEILPKLGGHYLDTLGLRIGNPGSRSNSLASSSPEELSTRQLEILKLIGDGLNNAEIATIVLVSESTVRQETIKIYRALAVSGRQEAMVKARAIGLIKKIQPSIAMVTEV